MPKSAGAVRELVASGALAMPQDGPLRVLDLGAGLGATTWGLARALEASGAHGEIDATWVDEDARALEVAQQIARARERVTAAVTVRARTVTGGAGLDAARGARFDVVLLGQVLSEHGRGLADRVGAQVELVRGLLLGAVGPAGSLVIVEPALRDRTRHLHALRDALLATSDGVTLFAPCLHAAPCPALAQPGDWCHEDLAVDLPAWLVPVARGAGLRWQGLTFSYLVLRRDGHTLRDALAPTRALTPARSLLRVVSGPLVSKGKREAFVCGQLAGEVGRVRARRLDRDATVANQAWDALARGALIDVDPPIAPGRPRIDREATIRPVDPDATRLPIDGGPRPR